jgi:hypothetical protein
MIWKRGMNLKTKIKMLSTINYAASWLFLNLFKAFVIYIAFASVCILIAAFGIAVYLLADTFYYFLTHATSL